jgi:hypothetical protein
MLIPVMFKDGKEKLVKRDELQYLMATRKVMFFKRSDGWVVVGRDKMRSRIQRYQGKNRRKLSVNAKDFWY